MVALLDNFNRADGGLGANWTTPSFSWSPTALAILSNQVKTGTGASWQYWNPTEFGRDCEVTVTVATRPGTDTKRFYIYLRTDVSGSTPEGYALAVQRNGTQCLVYFLKSTGGVETQLGSTASPTIVDGDTITFRVIGNRLEAFQNGALINSTTDSTFTKSGYAAIYMDTDSATRLDNFRAGDLVHPSFLTTIYDSFNRANGTIDGSKSDSGPLWAGPIHSGDGNVPSISSNALTYSAVPGSAYLYSNPGSDARCECTVTALGAADSEVQIVCRLQYAGTKNNTYTSQPFYSVAIRNWGAGDRINVFRHATSGWGTQLTPASGSESITITAGDKFAVVFTETNSSTIITTYKTVSGVWTKVASYTDTDSTRATSGSFGTYSESNTGWTIDDFTVTSVPMLDKFNRANEDPVVNGWSATPIYNPGIGNARLVSNKLANASVGGANGSYWSTRFGANMFVCATIDTAMTSGSILLYARTHDPGTTSLDGYLGALFYDAGGSNQYYLRIYREDDGGDTLIAQYNLGATITSGDKWAICVVGSELGLWWCPVSTGVWEERVIGYDVTYRNPGYAGVVFDNADTSSRMDDFGGGTVDTFPLTPVIDRFSRADGSLGGAWAGPIDVGDNTPTIYTRAMVTTASAYGSAYYQTITYKDCEVYATITSDVHISLRARVSNPNTANLNCYRTVVRIDNQTLAVVRTVNGSDTTLYSGTQASASGDQWGMRVFNYGNDIVIQTYRNGKLVRTDIDTGAVTSYSALAGSGYIGVAFYGLGNNLSRSVDDFGGGAVFPVLPFRTDDFNRADSASLGSAWTEGVQGTTTRASVSSAQLTTATGAGGGSINAYNAKQGSVVEVFDTLIAAVAAVNDQGGIGVTKVSDTTQGYHIEFDFTSGSGLACHLNKNNSQIGGAAAGSAGPNPSSGVGDRLGARFTDLGSSVYIELFTDIAGSGWQRQYTWTVSGADYIAGPYYPSARVKYDTEYWDDFYACVPYPDTSALDSFTRADQIPITSPWIGPIFTGETQLRLVSNQLANDGSDGNSYWNSAFTGYIEEWLTFTSSMPVNGRVILYLCTSVGATVNGYRVQFRNIAGYNQVFIDRVDAGIVTQLGATMTLGAPFASGDQFGAEVTGGSVVAYYKPVSTGLWVNLGARDDTTYTGPWYIGVSLVGAVTADNFGGGDFSIVLAEKQTSYYYRSRSFR